MPENLLTAVYREIYGDPGNPGKMKNLDELAATLSKIAQRDKPWTARYLNALLLGHKGFSITEELELALYTLAGRLDDQPPLQARARPIQVLTINGVLPGSIVLGHTKRCAGCQIPIVPTVPWQKYCCPECRAKTRKEANPPKIAPAQSLGRG
ncbi:MAG: hypothetical protein KDJ52_00105 [Anaerolineae bacterium]|nr:hypothetical protein [Anaerolineae bacterium]